jgi:hypothetical protein
LGVLRWRQLSQHKYRSYQRGSGSLPGGAVRSNPLAYGNIARNCRTRPASLFASRRELTNEPTHIPDSQGTPTLGEHGAKAHRGMAPSWGPPKWSKKVKRGYLVAGVTGRIGLPNALARPSLSGVGLSRPAHSACSPGKVCGGATAAKCDHPRLRRSCESESLRCARDRPFRADGAQSRLPFLNRRHLAATRRCGSWALPLTPIGRSHRGLAAWLGASCA